MSVFRHHEYRDHERVLFCRDTVSGLRAIIAIHSTRLGPAAGGCRMHAYGDENEALTDVLRLSQAMTVKNALAGLPLGGGKSVVIADPASGNKNELLSAFARFVEELGGKYWTAEDIGVGIGDVRAMSRHTKYVFGFDRDGKGSGDPSRFTALGVWHGMRAAVQHALDRTDMKGLKVAVQGVGNVGYELCKLLHDAGASLWVADLDAAALQRAVNDFGAMGVAPEQITEVPVDVISPCAMGGVLDAATVARLDAAVVAGAANNQLADAAAGQTLFERGIAYAPDFVINAGGMLNASCDIFGRYDENEVIEKIDGLFETTLAILQRATAERMPPERVAECLADEIVTGAASGTGLR